MFSTKKGFFNNQDVNYEICKIIIILIQKIFQIPLIIKYFKRFPQFVNILFYLIFAILQKHNIKVYANYSKYS